jgi:recombination protein RecR
MSELTPSTARLIEAFSKLPGIGVKTAQRLTYFLLSQPPEQAHLLAEALLDARDHLLYCSQCFTMTEVDPCSICNNPRRDHAIICVVEKPLDALAIEKTAIYQGVYHVLHGALNPMDGIGPKDLRIDELQQRLQRENIREVIIATNPDVEGEFTFHYLLKLLLPLGVKITGLARGLPTGGELEYADQSTLSRALEGRRAIEG